MDKTLSIPELLEAVLLQLPAKDVLLAQRVSKRWQDVIKDSVQVQQALFLKARPTTSLGSKNIPEVNPWLQLIVGSLGNKAEIRGVISTKDCLKIDGTHAGLPLAICEHESHVHISSSAVSDASIGAINVLPPGSWRDMFISNPPYPVHFLDDSWWESGHGPGHRSECHALTIGGLVNCMIQAAKMGNYGESPRYGLDRIGEIKVNSRTQ